MTKSTWPPAPPGWHFTRALTASELASLQSIAPERKGNQTVALVGSPVVGLRVVTLLLTSQDGKQFVAGEMFTVSERSIVAEAADQIDAQFGAGYAKKNPQVVQAAIIALAHAWDLRIQTNGITLAMERPAK